MVLGVYQRIIILVSFTLRESERERERARERERESKITRCALISLRCKREV